MPYFNNVNEIEGLISRLIDKLDASRTEELSLELDDVKIRLARHGEMPPPHPAASMPISAPASLPASMPAPDPDPDPLPAEPIPVEPKAPAAAVERRTVNAPLLGVAYAAPSPDAAPFVTVGQTVTKGDIICIIEAMKVMNEIEADTDGVIAEILFKNGEMVEYNQPLVEIK